MGIIEAIVLGIIQGLTEFLPISSSGHLVLFNKLFGITEGTVTFSIAVHIATLVAVVSVLWKDVLEMIKKPTGKLTLLVIVATIPMGIVGFIFKDLLKSFLETGVTVGFGFLITGTVLWLAEYMSKKENKNKRLEETSFLDALFVGCAQVIAMLPAVSRSGSTTGGALFRGLNREFALKFSFLMSIPAILGPAAIEAIDVIKDGSGLGVEFFPLIAGMLAAGISGYLAIKFMLKIFTKASLKVFSYYVYTLGVLVLIDQFITKIFFK
ncbi:MAG TPA: undecaprenyl-diphosphate phosphatase [Ruminiclostridium sp.]|jgi:undecaprenyl-diphosphatase|uniref:Undecaprenyl-diphosphatase n=1 Tax=Acetivibrio saccincola TaxID=1677857 RepID=A0A2S8R935_9FIRM|nr:undecaprenyl-diphosphate phosphatase [Acetivibrio saccincola]HAA42673.1 undecaprenyl-diphosphate phosphatase [Ruminiclostridium sp.]NLW27232.1 undecaprenyl-diphosphate phosphatase [Acetivibrio saccincola]PQQ66313.1 undecaprenyl-diphosphatase [Acetivibrio saccincola]HOA97944.1 undecaprenyl-diphosphate phosphatase [Acetivibrio saccincola]HQD28628.1 undecaprenyl-diphosphate phosphatase [Acetivibrio saccincola]